MQLRMTASATGHTLSTSELCQNHVSKRGCALRTMRTLILDRAAVSKQLDASSSQQMVLLVFVASYCT